jgi:putative endonuclease
MFYVYVLYSKTTDKSYVGFSGNLKKRLHDHLSKRVHTTKRMGNIELIFYEAYLVKTDVQRREKYFKTTKGKRTLKLMLTDYFRSRRLAA